MALPPVSAVGSLPSSRGREGERADKAHTDGVLFVYVPAAKVIVTGDALHGAFALALAVGRGEAEGLRFAAAVAGLKCTRMGGSVGLPTRAEVEAFIAGEISHFLFTTPLGEAEIDALPERFAPSLF